LYNELESEVFNMLVNSTDVQNNFGRYLNIAAEQEIIITRKGLPVARLVGINSTISFLSDSLVGLVPADVDEESMREERLSRQ
jgi:prevent-host-death family protein